MTDLPHASHDETGAGRHGGGAGGGAGGGGDGGAGPARPDTLDVLAALLGPAGFTRDAVDMAPWLTDWRGRYHGQALALVSPATTAETAAVIAFAARHGIPVVPQGGNTSMVAGATPDGSGRALLLSTRRMNRIRSVSPLDNVLIAEAGAVLATVHEAALAVDRRFPLTLGAKGSATIGGLVSTNAGGTQVLRFGPMRALVLGIEAVLPDGSVFDGLSALRKDNRGYDLRQLLCGAEGTLGVVTAVALRIVPAVHQRAVAWVGLSSPAAALDLLRAVEGALGEVVEGFELVPDAALDLVLRHVPGARQPLATRSPWNALIECGSSVADDTLGDRLTEALSRLAGDGMLEDAVIAATEAQADQLWFLRENITEGEKRDGGSAKHDVSVPVSQMPAYIESATEKVMTRFPGCRIVAFGHLGDGNIHFSVRPPIGIDPTEWLEREGKAVSAYVHDLLGPFGGSISAEHGIGQMKRDDFVRLSDPVRLNAIRAIKRAIDPQGIMNPGKVLPLAPDGPNP